MATPAPPDPVAFATRLLELVQEARTVTSYKYALLLALIDECQESVGRRDGPRGSTTTRVLARRVIDLYWRQTNPFGPGSGTLRQISGAHRSLVEHIAHARRDHPRVATSAHRFRLAFPEAYEDLVDGVEITLIRYPLPLLQRVGRSHVELLYRIGWEEQPPARPIRAYQRSLRTAAAQTGTFDNTVRFLPGVEAHLAMLAPLFRPLIRREWTRFVAQRNDLRVEELEAFLFEPSREDLTACRPGLVALQRGRCFYCAGDLERQVEVDHFLPWVRGGPDALDNLVAAHRTCNHAKRDHLAGRRHVAAWTRRMVDRRAQLADLARSIGQSFEPDRSAAYARALYKGATDVPLWLRQDEFELVPADEVLSLIP